MFFGRHFCVAVLAVAAVMAPSRLFADAPGFHYNDQRTGRTGALGPVESDILWTFQAGASIHSSPVVGSDGTIYLAAADGVLQAVDAVGQARWTFRAREGIYSTPALDEAGNIYFGDLGGAYYSIRPDGSQRWLVELTEGTDRRILGSPLVLSSGTSFITSWNGYLYAVDSAGNIVWRRYLGGGMPSSAPAADADGNVYVVTLEGSDLVAVKFSPASATPSVPIWTFREPLGLNRNRVIASPAIDASRNRLYVAASRTSDGVVSSVDTMTGQRIFSAVLPKGVVSSPALSDDGSVVIGSLDGQIYCLNRSGSILWSFKADGYYILGSPSIDGVGNIYFGDSEGTIYALSRDGRELWRTSSESPIVSSPVLANDRLYLTSCDSRLYALTSQSRTFYFPQIADGSAGGADLRTQFLVSNSGDDTQVQLEFFESSASPLALFAFPWGTMYSAFSIPLTRGESASFETTGFLQFGPRELSIGYARLTAGKRVSATAIVTRTESQTPRVVYQTSVPASEPAQSFSLFVDRTGGRETGLALVNAGDSDSDPGLSFYDSSGTSIVDRTMAQITGQPLAKGRHLARYAVELFPELQSGAVETGVIAVRSDAPMAAVALCEYTDRSTGSDYPITSLSTLPVIPAGGQGPPAARVFYFPQIGNGGSVELSLLTSLLFTNTGDETDVVVEFFDAQGQPLTLDLVGLGLRSSVAKRVSKGEVFSVRTTGEGPVASGYARVTTASTVSGTARFSFRQAGSALLETGVPACRPLNDCSVIQSSVAGSLETGIALVNTGNSPASVTLRVYDAAFRPIATRQWAGAEALMPGAHRARYAKEIFSDADLDVIPLGIITIQSDQPLAVLSLRHAYAPPRLIMLPVIEDRPDK